MYARVLRYLTPKLIAHARDPPGGPSGSNTGLYIGWLSANSLKDCTVSLGAPNAGPICAVDHSAVSCFVRCVASAGPAQFQCTMAVPGVGAIARHGGCKPSSAALRTSSHKVRSARAPHACPRCACHPRRPQSTLPPPFLKASLLRASSRRQPLLVILPLLFGRLGDEIP